MTSRRHHVAVVTVAGLYVAGFFTAIFLTVSNEAAAGHEMSVEDFVLSLSFLSLPLAGALIEWHRPRNTTGRLLLGIGVGAVLAVLGTGWAVYGLRAHPGSLPGGEIGAWLATWGLVAGFGLAPWFIATFPSGDIETNWLRVTARIGAVAFAVVLVAEAFAPGPIDGVPAGFAKLDNPLGVENVKSALGMASGLGLLVVVGFLLLSIVDLVLRYRRSSGDVRMQLRWIATATPVLPVSTALSMTLPQPASDAAVYVGQPLFLIGTLAGVVVAVLKYRLYDLDLFIRRSLVFTTLTLLVVAGYVGLVAATGAVLDDRSGPIPSLVAVGLVAVAFEPARRRVQRAIDHWAYGRRAEPYAVLSALGQQIESALVPDDALETIVTTIKDELRLGGVAIEVEGGRLAEVGTIGVTEAFPVVHQGRQMGSLVVTQRTPGEAFTGAERLLLIDLARQAGAAVHARELTAALQRSREQLVSDREEDRRRMRRDLHDGLGPTLAGMMLRAELAADMVSTDPNAAADELEILKHQLQDATDDVRRLVHGLRPPALDELGLVPALTAQAASLSSSDAGVAIEVDAPTKAPDLPAAVEVAVFRVVSEAMTNVVRHAQARICRVHLAFEDGVVVEVSDDGVGFDAAKPSGVGLRSMRERAAELGGTVDITGTPGRGTTVRLTIPVQAP